MTRVDPRMRMHEMAEHGSQHQCLRHVAAGSGKGEIVEDDALDAAHAPRLMQQEMKAVRAMQGHEREAEANALLRQLLASIWRD